MNFLQAIGRKKINGDTPKSSYDNPADQDQGHRLDPQVPGINGHRFSDETNHHIEDLKAGQNNILVAVRARPLSAREIGFSNFETVRILDGKIVVVLDPNNQFDANDVFRNNRNKEKQYAFDMAFDQDMDTTTVFENTTKFLIPGVLGGFNATIFAYGATGAGKTHTMLGNPNSPGIMYLTMNELFTQVASHSQTKDLVVKVSYLEVYNETVRDLLSDQENIVDIREDSKGIVIAGITEILTDSAQDVMELLRVGSKNRIMEPTAANTVSSRSHAVLQVTVEQREKNQGTKEETTVSKLSLIDLAGSERASNTNNKGQRMIEGANINRSLLALGNCITLLSEQMEKGVKVIHIPYRDSKLTRLLKDSLGGNCRTLMIANISPSVIAFEDTLNTLKYANRAKSIKTSVTRNVLSVEKHMDQYSNIISGLKNENEQLKRLLHAGHSVERLDKNVMGKEVASFNPNGDVIKDIKRHFDDEMKTKKRIFDLDLQNDDLQEKIMLMQYEADIQEDKVAKDRYQEYINMQKRISPQVDELRKEFSQLNVRRGQLQNRIQVEKNKDTILYLMSIFQQNEMIMENMELQHKEKRAENEVRLKDKQISYLESQLGIKGKPNGRSHLPSITPTQHLEQMNDFASQERPSGLRKDKHTDSSNFLNKLNDLDTALNISSSKALNSPHQALYLPHISPKGNYSSPNSRLSKQLVTPVKKIGLKQLSDRLNHGSMRKLATPQEGQYYYNKHDFMVQKAKAFDPKEVVPARKRYGQMPRRIRQKVNHVERFRSFDISEDQIGRSSERSQRSSVDKIPLKRNGGSLNDLGPDRVEPSSHEKKKNLLNKLNNERKKGSKPPPLTKLGVLKPYIQIPSTVDNQNKIK